MPEHSEHQLENQRPNLLERAHTGKIPQASFLVGSDHNAGLHAGVTCVIRFRNHHIRANRCREQGPSGESPTCDQGTPIQEAEKAQGHRKRQHSGYSQDSDAGGQEVGRNHLLLYHPSSHPLPVVETAAMFGTCSSFGLTSLSDNYGSYCGFLSLDINLIITSSTVSFLHTPCRMASTVTTCFQLSALLSIAAAD